MPGRRVRIKVCGITSRKDALAAVELGADALGFVFYEKSPRYIDPDDAARIVAALPPFVTTVGVFVDLHPSGVNRIVRISGLDRAQLHGDETPGDCSQVEVPVVKAFRVRGPEDTEGLDGYEVSAFLLDTYREGVPGGTGETFDWGLAAGTVEKGETVILSGGLNPNNVAEAVERVRPYGVDVSSGVEKGPGVKDHGKIEAFIGAARSVEL